MGFHKILIMTHAEGFRAIPGVYSRLRLKAGISRGSIIKIYFDERRRLVVKSLRFTQPMPLWRLRDGAPW